MSSLKRSIAIGFVLAFAWIMVPASVSPSGSIEVDGLCASGNCVTSSGSFCFVDGNLIWGKRNTIG